MNGDVAVPRAYSAKFYLSVIAGTLKELASQSSDFFTSFIVKINQL